MASSRAYRIGQTVNLRAKVSRPGTRTPTDPTNVKLVSLTTGSTTVLYDQAFSREREGDYVLGILTDALAPGVYKAVVRADSGPGKVWLGSDEFVLEAV